MAVPLCLRDCGIFSKAHGAWTQEPGLFKTREKAWRAPLFAVPPQKAAAGGSPPRRHLYARTAAGPVLAAVLRRGLPAANGIGPRRPRQHGLPRPGRADEAAGGYRRRAQKRAGTLGSHVRRTAARTAARFSARVFT